MLLLQMHQALDKVRHKRNKIIIRDLLHKAEDNAVAMMSSNPELSFDVAVHQAIKDLMIDWNTLINDYVLNFLNKHITKD